MKMKVKDVDELTEILCTELFSQPADVCKNWGFEV